MTPEQKEYYAQKLKEYQGSGRCGHDAYVIDHVFGMGSPNLGPVDPPVVGLSNDDDSFYATYFHNWAEVNAFIAQVRETAEQAWGKEGGKCDRIIYSTEMTVSSDNNLRIEPRKPLTEKEIIDLMPKQIPADYDGWLIEFAREIERAIKQEETK